MYKLLCLFGKSYLTLTIVNVDHVPVDIIALLFSTHTLSLERNCKIFILSSRAKYGNEKKITFQIISSIGLHNIVLQLLMILYFTKKV